jgi:hypothetical protein
LDSALVPDVLLNRNLPKTAVAVFEKELHGKRPKIVGQSCLVFEGELETF